MTAYEQEFSRVGEIDRALTEVQRQVDFLLNITPTNSNEAWLDFERSGFSTMPMLQSRPLGFEPDLIKRRLYDLEIEEVDDPGLAILLRQKRDELCRQVMLLEDRDSSRFLHGSLQLFGPVGDQLVDQALEILARVGTDVPEDSRVTATAFAERAEAELDHYRRTSPGFAARLEIRPDVPDLMVSHGKLLIGASSAYRAGRVEALIHHEVGTHVVTFENGRAQPLQLLAVGLPGYEETQEGLAVLAEFVAGGLDPSRLRLLAARVVAVKRVSDGGGFIDIFDELHQKHAFPPRVAWAVTVRVARSGGVTKDVIYLRGISRLLEFLEERKRLEPLFVGKMSLEHVPLIEDLLAHDVLRPARIRPRWLDLPHAEERMERIYSGVNVLDLVAAEPSA
jgi:uncharacterized protein (TIGR02421 family)